MPAKKLHLSPDLSLPLEAVTQKFAFVARSGAGKTYAAGKLAEELLEAKAQLVVVDPVGVWWGLRLAKDGKAKGFPIPVFGGEHGDMPLTADSGAFIADLIVEKTLSVVLDVSSFTGAEMRRFVTAFATQFLHRKKTAKSPVHIIWDEAQDFVPQKVFREVAHMVGAMERLVKQGRNHGIGTTLITQRPQAVNKDVLSQTELLFVLQINESQARKAIEAWIVSKGLDVAALADDLPSLPVGTAYLWSPQFLRRTEKVRIGSKWTYDASSTPVFGSKRVEPRELAAGELSEIETAMKAVLEKAAVNDPRAMQKRIAALEKELKETKAPTTTTKLVEVPVVASKDLKKLETLFAKFSTSADKSLEWATSLKESVSTLANLLRPALQPEPRATVRTMGGDYNGGATGPPKSLRKPSPVQGSPKLDANSPLPKGARDMLVAIVDMGPLKREAVAVRAVLAPGSGTFTNYLSMLRSQGLIEQTPLGFVASPEGRSLTVGAPLPLNDKALVEAWCGKLDGRTKDMLRLLASDPTIAYTRDQIANTVGLAAGSGTFTNYLSQLSSNGLIVKDSGGIRVSEDLVRS